MDDLKNENTELPTGDKRLTELLSTLRMEPTPEADFESRFLADFHRQLAEQQPATSFMERVRRFFSAVWQRKLVYGTSFAGACAMCVAYVAWVSGGDGTASSGVNNMQANFADTTDKAAPVPRKATTRKNKFNLSLFSNKSLLRPSTFKQEKESCIPAAGPSYDLEDEEPDAAEPQPGTLQD